MNLRRLFPILLLLFAACSHKIELIDLQTEAEVTVLEDQTSVLFTAQADTASVTVQSDGKWRIEAVNDRASDWLSYSPESGGKGETRVKIEVSANEEVEERSAVLHFRSGKNERTIHIVQKPEKAFVLSSEKAEFGPSGGQFELRLTSNVSYNMSIEDAPWLHQVITKAATDILLFRVDPNERADKRAGKLVFASELGKETVTVYQSGVEPELILSTNELHLLSEGGQFRVDVSSNFNAEFTVDADWVHEIATKALSTNTFYFLAERNPDYEPRKATLVFRDAARKLSGTVTIHQAQQDAIIIQNAIQVDYKPQTLDLAIGTNVDVTVSVPEEYSWLTPVKTKGLSKETFSFNVEKNHTKQTREADIILTSGDLRQSVRVKQLPTTNFPVTEKDWKESVKMAHTIGEKKEALFSALDESDNRLDKIIEGLLGFDEIVEVFEPTSENIVPVLMRDSIVINLMVESPVLSMSENNHPELNNEARLASIQHSLPQRQSKPLKKGKALILAPFQSQFEEHLDIMFAYLELFYSSDCIHTLQNSNADIRFFSGEKLSEYDLILISTHGGAGKFYDRINKENRTTSILASGTVFDDGLIDKLEEEGLNKKGLLMPRGSKRPNVCMTPDLLGDYSFEGSLVILSACETAKQIGTNNERPLVDRFLQNNALIVSGTEVSIDDEAAENYVLVLLQFMANGLPFQDAFRLTARSRQSVEWRDDYVAVHNAWREGHLWLKKAINIEGCDYNNIVYKPDVPQEDFSFYDQNFILNARPNIVECETVFSWSCDISSFVVRWMVPIYDAGANDYYWTFRRTNYVVKCKLFVDDIEYHEVWYDKIQNIEKSVAWHSLAPGDHNAYVEAYVSLNNEVLASYRSNTVKFTVSNNIKLTTDENIKDITIKSARISASYQSDYSLDIQEQGVVYSSTATEPVLNVSACRKQVTDKKGNPFTTTLTGLEPLTKYYARAYMIVGKERQVYYGNVIDFVTDPIENVVPPEILDQLDDHIPIYGGINPPKVEGQFKLSPCKLVYDSTNGFEVGYVFADLYFQFSNQDMENNTLDYREQQIQNTKVGKGAFISGEGDKFSVFFNTEGVDVYEDYSIPVKTALIISGIKTSSGIKDLNYAFVLVEKGADPKPYIIPEGSYRVIVDGDGISPNTNFFNAPSAAPAKAASNTPFLSGMLEIRPRQ